jgi:ketosteroid isomerase-like protein
LTGAEAVRRNFLRWFEGYASSIGQEVRDSSLLLGGDVAIAYMLIRTSGTLKTGREVGYWVRATLGCQRSDRGWVIAHEHISVPVDLASGKAETNLAPNGAAAL